MLIATICRRLATCLFLPILAAAAVTVAAPADAPDKSWAISWRPTAPTFAECKGEGLTPGRYREIQVKTQTLTVREFVDQRNGEILWACFDPVGRDKAAFQGGRHFRFSMWEAGKGRTILVYDIGKRQSIVLADRGHFYELDIGERIPIQSIDVFNGDDVSTLVSDQSDRGRGIYGFPIVPAVTTMATHWLGADIYGQIGSEFHAWPVCNRRRLNISLDPPSGGLPFKLECKRIDSGDHHAFELLGANNAKRVIFIHGGPVGRFSINKQSHLFQVPMFGYNLYALNYVDADPSPEDQAGAQQANKASRQIADAWQSVRSRGGEPPIILMESFGAQLLDTLLRRDEPVTIWAVSPVLSNDKWLAHSKERALVDGVPWADWRGYETLVSSRPDLISVLCSRKSHTKLVVISARNDRTIESIDDEIDRIRKCSNIDLQYLPVDGDDHASPRLYQILFQKYLDSRASRVNVSMEDVQ